ncbi:protein EMBRYONIC FLOWER 1 isoform X2 [Beta vulgaris subsp. vulgaris]|nr:protein EMBRYONIC FLOWER 1 isoform X2 [Beta vulgaris subsp. vulgaris]
MDLVPLNDTSSEKHNDFTVKCNHFSIRGYVSEVRKKDPKICYPFPLKDASEPLSIELPPMVVPKFRWWQCISCVPEASVPHSVMSKEVQKVDENVDVPLPLVGQSSKANAPRVRNTEASTSIDSYDNKNYSPLKVLSDPKGKGKAHVEDEPAPSPACENGFLKVTSQGILQQTSGKIEVSLAAGNEVAEIGSRCNGNGIIGALQTDSRVDDIEAGSAQEHVNHNGEYANENCRGKIQASLEDRHGDSPINDMGAEVVGFVNRPSNVSTSRRIDLPDLNECSGEPLNDEMNEAVITNSNSDAFCEDDDDYLGAECRKIPKVRLLSELLGLKEIQVPVKGRKKNNSLTSSLDENVKRKRVGSQDEGSKSVEIMVSDNGTKKVTGTTEISESDSEYTTDSDDVSTEIISKALAKRRCKSKFPLLEKRNKRSKFDHGGPSSTPQQKIMSRSAGHGKGKTSDNLPRRSGVFDQLVERSSVLTKKRGKVLQAGKEAASFISWKTRMPKDFAVTQKDENAERTPTQNAQNAAENVHFPRSYVIKRNCQVRAPPGEDGLCLPSSQAEPMLVDGISVRDHQENTNNVGDTSVAFRTTAVSTNFTENPLDRNGDRSIGAKANPKEKKTGIFEVEVCRPLAQDMHLQVSNSAMNPKELTNEVRGRMHDIDINSIPTDDKSTEQGPSDDIPMDIVELMAKNQYERHLGDPKEKHVYPPPPGISARYIRDNGINGSYGEYWHKFGQSHGQPHFLNMQKPPFTDTRNCMVNGNLGHFSDFNRNSQSVTSCLPRENPVYVRYSSPTHGQDHCPPYPPCGLVNNWNESINMAAAQRYPPSFLQAVESYRLQACAPRPSTAEGSRVWPSVVASRMPLGITNPQIISQSSNILNKGKIHHQTSGSILNFNSSGTTSLGKQQNLNFSNGYNIVGHPESSAGSAADNMYTNDAISAMHLLSLMQNAAKMQNPALSLGPQKMVGPTSSRQPFVESNGRSSGMQDSSRHPCYPTAIPVATVRPFASTFQRDGANIGRNSSNPGFVGPIPLTLRGQRNMESSHFVLQGGDHRPQRRQMGSFLEKGKDISAISHPSYVNPLQSQSIKDSAPGPKFLCGGGVRHDERTITPIPEKEICRLNQNPSEFNDLRELSRYMIGPDDLRPRGMARQKSYRPRADVKKQDVRLKKTIPSSKEREWQRKS